MKKIIPIVTTSLLLAVPGYCATYWVSPTGAAANLAACSGTTPLSGASACSYDKANGAGVTAGDTVYYRAGDYNVASGAAIAPANSGTSSSNRITFAAYPGEQVNFIGTAEDSSVTGLSIVNKNWIKVTGYDGSTSARKMKFSNMGFFLMIWDGLNQDGGFGAGSDYNEVSYCEFAQTVAGWVPGNYADTASRLMHNSTYNWLHHNTFRDMGGYTSDSDIGACLNMGWEDCGLSTGGACSDNTSNNVLEENIFYHGGHQTLGLFNYNNVVRNNTLHNERWYYGADNVYHGYRVIQTQVTYNADYHHSYNLIENNKISHSSENMIAANLGGTGLHLSLSNTIIRQNSFYSNNGNAILFESHARATTGRVNYNHIYNNTFFANGYGAPTPSGKSGGAVPRGTSDRTAMELFIGEYGQFETTMYGNVIKNNLGWKNPKMIGMTYDSTYGSNFWSDCPGYTICGDTVISNNFNVNSSAPYADVASPVDPVFTNEGSYTTPVNSEPTYDWYWTTPDGSDVTATNTEPTFTLQAASPAIDNGTFLTTATTAGSNSTSLVVADAKYFQPGWGNGAGGGASVAADWIAIGTTGNLAQIASINYGTNTITLTSQRTWDNNASVWLYKKSDGGIVLYGAAPDTGAYEYSTGSVPGPPTISSVTVGYWSDTVVWDNVSGATSYNIYWSGTTGTDNTDTKITGVTSPYRHANLIGNTTYCYVMTSVNADGESTTVGNEVCGTPKFRAWQGGTMRGKVR